jgi:hypothetical protein
MVREQNGRAIFWNGHLCEGNQMMTEPDTFIFWTRCQKLDVPVNAAHQLKSEDHITCDLCRKFLH